MVVAVGARGGDNVGGGVKVTGGTTKNISMDTNVHIKLNYRRMPCIPHIYAHTAINDKIEFENRIELTLLRKSINYIC